jgi:hypothetical protein
MAFWDKGYRFWNQKGVVIYNREGLEIYCSIDDAV